VTGGWPEPVRAAIGVIVVGLSVGAAATLVALLLHLVQHVAYGYVEGTFLIGVEQADPLRRLIAPTVGVGLSGLGWMWLRRRPLPEVGDACGPRPQRLPLGRTTLDAILQIVAVGSGASIGREGAPRQVGAALASTLSSLLAARTDLRRRLVIAGAGAGLAVVYNVPLSGVVFGAEVLAGGFGLSGLAISVPVCALAVGVSWLALGAAPTYLYPEAALTWPTLVWAVIAAPLCAVVGSLFDALMRRCQGFRPGPGWALPVAAALGGLAVGVASLWLPSLPGNGKGIVQLALDGGGSLLVFAVLLAAKPLATGITYGSGVTGGFLTPALGTGAALGAAVALAGEWAGQAWPVPVFALIGAVGVLAATQRAPWFAAVFGWELARPPILVLGLLLVVAWGAVPVARRLAWPERGGTDERRSTDECEGFE
jgi:H+/Cl- antiporter ClcA